MGTFSGMDTVSKSPELRGMISAHDAGMLFERWYKLYSKDYRNGRKIKIKDNSEPYRREYLKTNPRGFSELMTYICDYLSDSAIEEITLGMSRKGREVHMCFSTKTKRGGILNPVSSVDEYEAAMGGEDKRLSAAFKAAYYAYASIYFSRNIYGEEYIGVAFNRADIGELGFKAVNIDIALIHGISFAYYNIDKDKYEKEEPTAQTLPDRKDKDE